MDNFNIDNYNLSEIEIEKLVKLQEDTVLKGALKKFILEGIYLQGVVSDTYPLNRNWALSSMAKTIDNEQLGREVRGMAEGLMFLETAFKNLEKVKKAEKVGKVKTNPAR